MDGHWMINGGKIYITNVSSSMAGGITVQAVTGDRGKGMKELSVILVDRETPGYQVRSDPIQDDVAWGRHGKSKFSKGEGPPGEPAR